MKKIIVILVGILVLCGCSNQKMDKYDMFYMDTYIEIKLYDVSNSSEVFKKIDSIYKEYNQLCDRYNSYDGIVNVYYLNNDLKIDEKIEIDKKLSELIKYGLNMYDETDGYINIALGHVIDVWKKYRDEGTDIPQLVELMTSGAIDINDVYLEGNEYMRKSDVKLDLGSYAKGYVTEIVGEYLENEGINKYLINAGGNVKVGSSYKSDGYAVGIEEPFNTSKIYKVLHVENESVVTSGSYQRYYEYNGKNYNHIINPKTLFPDNYTKSVTVITKDSKKADILSTYLFLLPIDDGLEYVNNLDDVEAIWYSDEIYYSNGFDKYE